MNFYRKINVKNIGIYRNFLGKYRINLEIFKSIAEKKDVNKEFTDHQLVNSLKFMRIL